MVDIGSYSKLEVIKKSDEGVYLDAKECGALLLPRDQVLTDCAVGEAIEVFIYSDSEHQAIATTEEPYAHVGQFVCLEVVDVMEMGAFLDWGLPKDLFVPLSEQKEAMKVGEFVIVYIFKDERRKRVAASSKLDNYLEKEPPPFKTNDQVELLICHQTELGYNAIINDAYWGLLYKDEVFQALEYGQIIKGFIKKNREDGKIDLSLERQGYQKLAGLEEQIIAQLKKEDGVLKVTDKSTPAAIYKLFGVSKKKYKMSLGALYKAKRIVIEDEEIKLI